MEIDKLLPSLVFGGVKKGTDSSLFTVVLMFIGFALQGKASRPARAVGKLPVLRTM